MREKEVFPHKRFSALHACKSAKKEIREKSE